MPRAKITESVLRHFRPGTPDVAAWLVAAGLVAFAIVLSAALSPIVPEARFILLFLAAIMTATIGGAEPGLFAVIAGAAGAWYFVSPPPPIGSLLLFVAAAIPMVIATGVMRVAIARSSHPRHSPELTHSPEEMRVWADAFTHAAVGLTITDPNTRSLRFVNKAWAEMHGWSAEEVLGMPTSMFFPEDELPRLASLYAEADRTGHVTFEVRRLRKDGSTFLAAFDVVTVLDADGALLYRVASSRDITESKRAEELLRHATRMEAIGALTGGMAHDFNNLLGAIILSLDFVQTEMPDTDPFKPFVMEARSAAESGAELIRNLLAFARRQSLHPTRIEVNDHVRGMHRLLSRVLGEEIEIVLDCAADIWPVIADPSQLEACITEPRHQRARCHAEWWDTDDHHGQSTP